MIKSDIKDIIIKLLFILVGIFFGFAFFYVDKFFSQNKGILYIIFILLILCLISVFERINCKIQYEKKINLVIENIKKADIYKTIKFDNLENESFINELYKSIEYLRKNLNKKNNVLQSVLDFINTLAFNIEIENLAEIVLSKLIIETNSNWGVFYVYNNITEKLELKKSIGLSKKIYKQFDIELGEGFLGIAAISKNINIYKDIPKDTIFENRTFMGKIIPKNIMTVPILYKDSIKAILSFGSMYDYNDDQIELVETIKDYLGFSINNCIAYERSQRMANELQFQNQLIQNMNDELEKKVNDRTEFLNTIINFIEEYSIVSIDIDGYITTWNKGAEKNDNYRDFEVIGKHISYVYGNEFIDNNKNYDITEKIRKYCSIAEEKGIYSSKCWKLKKDGTKFFADITIIPVYENNEKIQGFTIITKDITENEILKQKVNFEKAYNDKIIEDSKQLIIVIDKNGLIINSNKLAENILVSDNNDLKGKYIFEFFKDRDYINKNIEEIISTGIDSEFNADMFFYKQNNFECIKLIIKVIISDMENVGAIIYIDL